MAGALVAPAVAFAGFDNPLKHTPLDKRAAEAAIPGKHCSKIGNPFECSRDKNASYPQRLKLHDPYRKRPTCRWAHAMYDYHHPPGTAKPWSLVAYHGCFLWHADLRYHSAFARAKVDDSVVSMLESQVLSSIPQLIDIGGTQ